MPLDLEENQGLVLRQIVVGATAPVTIAPFNLRGRLDAFILNDRVGVFIKYSNKRLTPWPFTFHLDQVAELLDLEIAYPRTFVAFVCGPDGVAVLDVATLHELMTFKETEQAWLRVERRPRTLYSLSGNRNALDGKVARGVHPITQALEN